jgi:hypothetical protein
MKRKDRTMRNTLSLLLAFVLGVGVVGTSTPAAASAGERAPAAETTTPVAATKPSAQSQPASSKPASDAATYASREKQAGDRKDFRGGSVSIYLGGSAVAIVLIIILVVLIL